MSEKAKNDSQNFQKGKRPSCLYDNIDLNKQKTDVCSENIELTSSLYLIYSVWWHFEYK